MRLTTRGRYAVTALLDLAIQESSTDSAVALSEVAQRQSISMSYLEQLFSKLRKSGLISSTRGASGGYRLAKPLTDINVLSIIQAVDESVQTMQCGGKSDCHGGAMCLTHDLWYALSLHIEGYLQNITLAQLLALQSIDDAQTRHHSISSQTILNMLTPEETTDSAGLFFTTNSQKKLGQHPCISLNTNNPNSPTANPYSQ